jgi:2-hydroxychromene-2-carboxylate isomerase
VAYQIDYFYAVLSPFTYLADNRLDVIAAKYGATVVHKPLDIFKMFSETGGTPPPKRHPSRQAYRKADLKRVARRAKLHLNVDPAFWPTGPLPASRFLIAAQNAGYAMGPLSFAVTRAVWSEERNIAEESVLQDIADENDIPFHPVWDAAQGVDRVFEDNTTEAIRRGVFGAPSYILRDEVFWGQDRLDHLEDALYDLK